MRFSRTLGIVAFLTAIAAPAAASANTYNFTIPVRLTGIPGGSYQFNCTAGTTTIPSPGVNLGTVFTVSGTSFTGTVTASAQTTAPEHSYTCVLYQIVSPGSSPATAVLGKTGAQVSGTM
jgi:hypothetical protein